MLQPVSSTRTADTRPGSVTHPRTASWPGLDASSPSDTFLRGNPAVRSDRTVRGPHRQRVWDSGLLMSEGSTRLAVQSPRRLVRDALCAYLAGWPEFEVVGQTADVDALFALCELRQPNTVLVDADRVTVETVGELSRLRSAFPLVQIIVLYNEFGPRALAAALQADITGLVPGNRGLNGLLRALRLGPGTAHRSGPDGLALTERGPSI